MMNSFQERSRGAASTLDDARTKQLVTRGRCALQHELILAPSTHFALAGAGARRGTPQQRLRHTQREGPGPAVPDGTRLPHGVDDQLAGVPLKVAHTYHQGREGLEGLGRVGI